MTVVHYIALKITEDEWLRYYSGEATHIRCTSTNGQSIQIAARHFRQFTTKIGVEGLFKLTLRQNRFVSLIKIR